MKADERACYSIESTEIIYVTIAAIVRCPDAFLGCCKTGLCFCACAPEEWGANLAVLWESR